MILLWDYRLCGRRAVGLGEGAAAGAPGVRGGSRVRKPGRAVGPGDRGDAAGARHLKRATGQPLRFFISGRSTLNLSRIKDDLRCQNAFVTFAGK